MGYNSGKPTTTIVLNRSNVAGATATAAFNALKATVDALSGGGGGSTWGLITGTLSDQADLQAALDAKADDSDITSLDTRVDALEAAPPAHTHVIGDIISLQTTLDAKADDSDITALDARVDALELAPPAHPHAQSEITNLVSDLAAKQPLDADLTAIAGLTRTKGDLIVGGASAWVDLPVGSDNQVLTADASQASGVKWATPSSAGDVSGPASSVAGEFAVFDDTTGKVIDFRGDCRIVGTVPNDGFSLYLNPANGTVPSGGDGSFGHHKRHVTAVSKFFHQRELSGLFVPLAPDPAEITVAKAAPTAPSSTSFQYDELTAFTVSSGTLTARTITDTADYYRVPRVGLVSAASIGAAVAIHQGTVAQTIMRNLNSVITFAIADTNAPTNVMRAFIGWASTGAAAISTTVNPNTLQNCIGIGQVDGSTNWHIIRGSSGAAAASVDTGVAISRFSLIRLEITYIASSNSVYVGMGTPGANSDSFNTTYSTTIPAVTEPLVFRAWRSNGIASTSVAIDLVNLTLVTPRA